MPQHQYVVDSRARLIVCQQGNHTAIQVLLHRDRTGALPASLSDLSTSPFIDPYSGKPFAYVPRDGDFTLYSIGHDGWDDGGRHSSRALRDPLGDRVFWPLSARFEAEGE
jgi:hypothetical protein